MENRNVLDKQSIIAFAGIIVLAVLSRLIPHPANFAPIGALALFSGAHFSGKSRFIIPLLVMIFSDMIIGFHSMMFAVYLSFILTVGIGIWLKKKQKLQFIIGASLTSSVLFFILTNFNYWSNGMLYPKTIQGLIESYTMAIPFFRNTVAGDLFYTSVFFYGFKYITNLSKRIPSKLFVGSNQ